MSERPFVIAADALARFVREAAAGDSLRYALAAFLPKGSEAKGLALVLAERGFIRLCQRREGADEKGVARFAYIAQRTAKPWPQDAKRAGVR